MDDTNEQVEALNAALEAAKLNDAFSAIATQGSTFQIVDQMHSAKKYLTESAINDLSRKATTMIALRDDGTYAKVVFFSVVVKSNNVEAGVEKLSTIMNELSSSGLIHSALSPIRSLELARMPMKAQSSVVIAYVLVPGSLSEEIEKKYANFVCQEGGVGESIDDLRPDLKDGEFLAQVRVSSILSMIESTDRKSPDELLQEQIDHFLAVLPRNTQIKEVVRCAVTDLSLPYEIRFFNPLMKSVKEVILDYVRTVEVIDDKIVQFNLFTGIRYFDSDNKQLFNYK